MQKESERNYRERLKSKFEMIIGSYFMHLLTKQVKLLQSTLPGAALPGFALPAELEGGPTSVQRQALSKDKLRYVYHDPAAQYYKLDNIDVMQQIL